jgi:hypothetical protein
MKSDRDEVHMYCKLPTVRGCSHFITESDVTDNNPIIEPNQNLYLMILNKPQVTLHMDNQDTVIIYYI